MIILNTTFFVNTPLVSQFLTWVKDTYIPSALFFLSDASPVVARIMAEPQEGMSGYAVQLHFRDLEQACKWHDGDGAILRDDIMNRYNGRILFFSTYMEKL